MSAAVSHHLQKPAAAVLVLVVLAQMRGKLVYLLGQEGNLHLRGAGILVVDSGFFDGFSLFLLGKHGVYKHEAVRPVSISIARAPQLRKGFRGPKTVSPAAVMDGRGAKLPGCCVLSAGGEAG